MESGSFDRRRLTLARWDAGLTKRELAARAGLSPASLTQYELGNTIPRYRTMTSVALALGVPIDYLMATSERRRPLLESRSFFRSLRSTRQWERNQADARAEHVYDVIAYLERALRLPEVDLPEISAPQSASRSTFEGIAAELRAHWRMPPGPVSHVVRLLEAHGVVVARLRTRSPRLDAFSRWFEKRPVVLLWDGKADKGRSRFDAAHELAHLVIHDEPDPGDRLQERQAHALAAAFLMPAGEIVGELPRRAPRGADWDALYATRARWGVSVASLLYRARELRTLSDAAFRRAMMRLNELGIRHDDGNALGEPEQPRLLPEAVDTLMRLREMSPDQLAQELCFSRRQLGDVLGEYNERTGPYELTEVAANVRHLEVVTARGG